MKLKMVALSVSAVLLASGCNSTSNEPVAVVQTPEQVIEAIDSSSWAVDPKDYGMTAMEYQYGEANRLFGGMQKRAGGVNKFHHFPGLAKAGDDWVVSPNNDTIYSLAVIDAREGFSITVPDVGDRFLSIHIQDNNHTFVGYEFGGGTYTIAAEDVDTDYVLIGIRMATDASAEDVAHVVNDLQPQYKIEAGSNIDFTPYPVDMEKVGELRAALINEYNANYENTYGTVQYDIRDVDNWEHWTLAMAAQWGLSPEDTAMYPTFAPANTKGNVCYTATFDEVPVDAFASLTLYNAENLLMSNEDNIISTNRDSFKANEDGSFEVVFGGEDCRAIAQERNANFGYTPADGWSGLIRAYNPDVAKMYEYKMPELKEIK